MPRPRQPVCWEEMHYRLVSLWELLMEKFDFVEFMRLWSPLFGNHVADNNLKAYEVATYIEHSKGVLRTGPGDATYDKVAALAVFLRAHGLEQSALRADRITAELRVGTTANELNRNIGILHGRLVDEMQSIVMLAIPASRKKLYEQEEPLFGADVFEKFEDARDDIEEAGKCLALGRNKACVCHLMLAMEVALRELADKVDATLVKHDGSWLPWLVIVNNLKAKIDVIPEGDGKVAWWEAHAMLNSVGKAWRNPTMHPARSYDTKQATKVFDAVKGFMQDLAKLL